MSGIAPEVTGTTVVAIGDVVDSLSDADGTVVLVPADNASAGAHVVHVSVLGEVVLDLLATGPSTVADLAAKVVAVVGQPPSGDAVTELADALSNMSRHGLIRLMS